MNPTRKSGLKSITIFFLSLIMLTALCGCARQNNLDQEKPAVKKLIAGSDEYEPYVYMDQQGGYAGIDVEIAKEAGRRIGYEIEFIKIKWSEKDNDLAQGKIDCAWGSFSMNGREDLYQWAGPYLTSRQVVAVRADSKIYRLSDLGGREVAVEATTQPEKMFLEHTADEIPAVGQVYSFTKPEEAFAALRKGYVDACAGHEMLLMSYCKNAKEHYRILNQPLMISDLGVAFSKEYDSTVVETLSAALAEMKEDGTIDRIVERYRNMLTEESMAELTTEGE